MMPSTLNPRAPRLSLVAGDAVAVDRDEALRIAHDRAMARGRQSVRPARQTSQILCWLIQDVRYVAPRPASYDVPAERVHAS